ncbi:hypothetical protein Hanom_Chr10g00898641 [Helianthus anomalus]
MHGCIDLVVRLILKTNLGYNSLKNIRNNNKSKLQKSSFMLTLDSKVCHLSSKSTKNVLDVCKPLHVLSFSPNSLIFHGFI